MNPVLRFYDTSYYPSPISLRFSKPSLLFIYLVLLVFVANDVTSSAIEYDSVYPIHSKINQEPVGYVETKAIRSDFHQGYLGCLQEQGLCNDDEACFDDGLFGQCVSKDGSGSVRNIPPVEALTPQQKLFLADQLRTLVEGNFSWKDDYSQCVVQATLASISNGLSLQDHIGICQIFLDDSRAGDVGDSIEEKLSNTLNNLEKEVQEEEDEESFRNILKILEGRNFGVEGEDVNDSTSSKGSSGAEKDYWRDGWRAIHDISAPPASSSDPASINPDNVLEVGGDLSPMSSEMEPIILDPRHQPIVWYEESPKAPQGPLNISPFFFIEDQNGDSSAIDMPSSVGSAEDKLLRVRRHFPRIPGSSSEGDIVLGEGRGYFKGREEDGRDEVGDQEMVFPVSYGGQGDMTEILSRHKFDEIPNQSRGVESDEDQVVLDLSDNGSEDDNGFHDNPSSSSNMDGEESRPLLFNRRERLDVKKPGPYWPQMSGIDRALFENQVLNDGSEMEESLNKRESRSNPDTTRIFEAMSPFASTNDGSRDSSNEVGQVEYEMPLLAPVKDKRVLNIHQQRQQPLGGLFQSDSTAPFKPMEKRDFVHMFFKNRLSTDSQGNDLINTLAEIMGISPEALTERLVEEQHVQFRVNQNPQNVDADNMVDNIEHNADLQKRLNSDIGVDVEEAAPGTKHDYIHRMSGPRSSLVFMSSHLNLVLGVASVTAAVIAAIATVYLVRWRTRGRGKLAQCSGDEDDYTHEESSVTVLDTERGKVQEEYKQLCRDWSRSSKTTKGEGTPSKSNSGSPSGAKGKLHNQDSKNSDKSSTSSWGEEPTCTNMDISTGHMVLAYMEDHLKNKQRLEQEWVGLCSYEAEPCATTTAFKAENKKKNRYPDKLPYDHNRVILNAVLNASNSDYINASTVSDHDPRNPSYIVTQGPLAQTVADFWQMIWEQGCVVIVMLTRLQDNGYQLCHRYWPEEGSEQYHIFEVHLVSEHVWCDDYLVRSVYLKNTRTGETRTVTQFHFRSWPAQSVPASTKALLEFRRKVNKSYRGRSCPIAIHCSDGVGRTGTYVLIDMVLNRMAKGCKEIDIAATLEHIRDQRSGMVQTRPQFEFSLMAVAEEVHAILKALLP